MTEKELRRTFREFNDRYFGDALASKLGQPMLGSALVRDPTFQDRVVAETRALLSTIPK